MHFQGNPYWYDLTTTPGDLAAAGAFYGKVLGWQTTDAGMPGFTYHLATAGDEMVAGLMEMPAATSGMPPMWMIYFAADDLDKTIAEATAAGATVHSPAAEIPGTGRFAILADPQGAAFGLMEPDMSQMSEADREKAGTTGAFDQKKPGHGNWNELMTSDPAAALGFYSGLFGWTKGQAMDMGADGTYQLIRRNGGDIGAIQGLGNAPAPVWLPYFGVGKPLTEVVAIIADAGGTVHHGPVEVPGPAWIAIASDPQGAWFAVVGETR